VRYDLRGAIDLLLVMDLLEAVVVEAVCRGCCCRAAIGLVGVDS
jgi:hypothetical protein